MSELKKGDWVKISNYGKERGIHFPNRIKKAEIHKIYPFGLIKIKYNSPKSGKEYFRRYSIDFLKKTRDGKR